MKIGKKIATVLLAIALVMQLSPMAFASAGDDDLNDTTSSEFDSQDDEAQDEESTTEDEEFTNPSASEKEFEETDPGVETSEANPDNDALFAFNELRGTSIDIGDYAPAETSNVTDGVGFSNALSTPITNEKRLIIVENDITINATTFAMIANSNNVEVAIKGATGQEKLSVVSGRHFVITSNNTIGGTNTLIFDGITLDMENGSGGITINNIANGSLKIDGSGTTTIQGSGNNATVSNPVITNSSPLANPLEIKNLSIDNFTDSSAVDGVAIGLTGSSEIVLEGVSITRINNGSGRAAVHVETTDELQILDCEFSDNESTVGGALYFRGGSGSSGKTFIENSTFSNNRSNTLEGGAVYLTNAYLGTISKSFFTGNQANTNGGALYTAISTEIVDTEFVENISTSSSGGAIHASGSLLITSTSNNRPNQTLFQKNQAFGTALNRGGGAIHSSDALEIGGGITRFVQNEASNVGGGVFASGSCNISESYFTAHTAQDGGALYLAGVAAIEDSEIDSSRAENGAAIYNAGDLTTNTVSLTKNVANNAGGGIYSQSDSSVFVHLKDSIIANNEAVKGGGLYCDNSSYNNGTVKIERSVIGGESIEAANKAMQGAGIYSSDTGYDSMQTLFEFDGETSICNNEATDNGGGLYMENGPVSIEGNNAVVSDNKAQLGGGLYTDSDSDESTIDSMVFLDNKAEAGGALYAAGLSDGNTIAITNSQNGGIISNNTAKTNGGGLYSAGSSITLEATDITSNAAGNDGGGLYYAATSSSAADSVTIRDANITNNQAGTDGGGIGIPLESGKGEWKTVKVEDSSFKDNTAKDYVTFITSAEQTTHDSQISVSSYSDNPYGRAFLQAYNNYDVTNFGPGISIVYHFNDGEDDAVYFNVDTYEAGSAVSIVSDEPEHRQSTDFVFLGWNTQSDGSGDDYSSGQSVSDSLWDSEVHLYAKWLDPPHIDVKKSATSDGHGTNAVFSQGTIAYEVTLENTGKQAWGRGVFADILESGIVAKPETLTITDAQTGQDFTNYDARDAWQSDSQTLTITWIVLQPGQKIIVRYTATAPRLDASESDRDVSNTVTASGYIDGQENDPDATEYTGSADAEIPVVPNAGTLELVKDVFFSDDLQTSVDGGTVAQGDTLVYSLVAKNVGNPDSILHDVVISDVIPPGLTFKPDSVAIDGQAISAADYDFDEDTRMLTYSYGESLYGGDSFTLTFAVEVTIDAGGNITNVATGETKFPNKPLPPSEADEDDFDSDSDGDNARVEWMPDVDFYKAGPGTAVLYGNFDYVITLENNEKNQDGNEVGSWNGHVWDELTTAIEYQNGTLEVAFFDEMGQLTTDSYYDSDESGYDSACRKITIWGIHLRPGHTMIVTFTVQVVEAVGAVENIAHAVFEDDDDNDYPAEDVKIVQYTTGELEVKKTARGTDGSDWSTRELDENDTFIYRMEVSNTDSDLNSGLLDLHITDVAPDDIDFDLSTLSVEYDNGTAYPYTDNGSTAHAIDITFDHVLCGGQTAVISVEATVVSKSRSVIVNMVEVAGKTVPEEWSNDDPGISPDMIDVYGTAEQRNATKDYVSQASIEVKASETVFSGGLIDYTFTIVNESTYNSDWKGNAYVSLPPGVTLSDSHVLALEALTFATSGGLAQWSHITVADDCSGFIVYGLELAYGATLTSAVFKASAATLDDADSPLTHTVEAYLYTHTIDVLEDFSDAETLVVTAPGKLKLTKYVTLTDVTHAQFLAALRDGNDDVFLSDSVLNGTDVRYWIVAENAGRRDTVLYDVVIEDSIDAALTAVVNSEFVTVQGAPHTTGSLSWNALTLRYEYDQALKGGSSFVLSFDATIDITGRIDTSTQVKNVASGIVRIPSDPVPPDEDDDTNRTSEGPKESNENETDLLSDPALSLVKKANVHEMLPGGDIVYSIELSNKVGASTWKGTLTDELDTRLSFDYTHDIRVSFEGAQGGSYTTAAVQSSTLEVQGVVLPGGAKMVVTFMVSVAHDESLIGSVIPNVAEIVHSDEFPPDKTDEYLIDDEGSVDVGVIDYKPADIVITKNATKDGLDLREGDSVSQGDTIVYAITAEVSGGDLSGVRDLVITDVVPPDVTFKSFSVKDGKGSDVSDYVVMSDIASGTLSLKVAGPLASGQKIVLEIVAEVTNYSKQNVINTAIGQAMTQDPDDPSKIIQVDDSDWISQKNKSYNGPDMQITITADETIYSGESITYVVAATNNDKAASWSGDLQVGLAPGLDADGVIPVLTGSAIAGSPGAVGVWNADNTVFTITDLVFAPDEDINFTFATEAVTLSDHHPKRYSSGASLGEVQGSGFIPEVRDSADTWVLPRAGELGITKNLETTDTTVRNGAILSYSITAENSNADPATVVEKVSITDELHDYLAYVEGSLQVDGLDPVSGSVSYANHVLSYVHPEPLGGLESFTITFDVRVAIPLIELSEFVRGSQEGIIGNSAVGIGKVPDELEPPKTPQDPDRWEHYTDDDDEDSSDDIVLLYQPDVTLTKRNNNNDVAVIGGTVEYVIAADNAENADGWYGQLTDKLDDRLDLESTDIQIEGSGTYESVGYDEATRTIIVAGVTLEGGQYLEITFICRVNDTALIGDEIPNVVQATPDYRDDEDEDKRSDTVTLVEYSTGSLQVEKLVYSSDGTSNLETQTLQLGQQVQYCITGTNSAERTSVVENVVIADPLIGMKYATDSLRVYNALGEELAYSEVVIADDEITIELIDPLYGGDEVRIYFVVTIESLGDNGALKNVATMTGETPDKEDPSKKTLLQKMGEVQNPVVEGADPNPNPNPNPDPGPEPGSNPDPNPNPGNPDPGSDPDPDVLGLQSGESDPKPVDLATLQRKKFETGLARTGDFAIEYTILLSLASLALLITASLVRIYRRRIG